MGLLYLGRRGQSKSGIGGQLTSDFALYSQIQKGGHIVSTSESVSCPSLEMIFKISNDIAIVV